MNAFPRSHANEARFAEPSDETFEVDQLCTEVEAAVEQAYSSFHNIADYVEKIDSFLGDHAKLADWRDVRSDAAADVEAVHVLMVQAEMALALVAAAIKVRGA